MRAQLEALFGEAEASEEQVHARLGPAGKATAWKAGTPKALIAPHAGYVYSGPIAASGYSLLQGLKGTVETVVLVGPAHRYAFRGLAGCTATAFESPLGDVPLDQGTLKRLAKLPQVHLLDQAHEGEHSLEVHLPFLQWVLGDFSLVPLVVGDATYEEVAEVLLAAWGGAETLVVVSSDLSHFLPYRMARKLDEDTAGAIEALRPQDIGSNQACGRVPLGGLLLRAKEEGLVVDRVDLRNSGDTAGSRNQVVGYGSWIIG
ncbi:AmmeMemoRadiSam system protein B [Gemmatimonadota bacterium]